MIEQAERVMSSAYMQWAKTHLQARFNLASSGLEPYSLAKLRVKIDNLELTGPSFYGYEPLQKALAKNAACRQIASWQQQELRWRIISRWLPRSNPATKF